MASMLHLQTRLNTARGVTATHMPQAQLDQLQALEVLSFVTGNTTNVWLVTRDRGVAKHGAYDKWRITQWWCDRYGVWQRGNSSIAVDFADSNAALYALNALAVVLLTPDDSGTVTFRQFANA